jgi:hypothetical protein
MPQRCGVVLTRSLLLVLYQLINQHPSNLGRKQLRAYHEASAQHVACAGTLLYMPTVVLSVTLSLKFACCRWLCILMLSSLPKTALNADYYDTND